MPDRADVAERLERRIRGPDRPVAVAELEDAIRGSIVFGPSRDPGDDPGIGEIYALYVHPRSWRRGAGRALVAYALDWLRERGFSEAVLWTFAETARSRAFYEALGFADDGEAQPPDDRRGA
jgi:GNAT superfamily N-acetyltransferase